MAGRHHQMTTGTRELKGLFLLHLASKDVWSHRPPGRACIAPEELGQPSRC